MDNLLKDEYGKVLDEADMLLMSKALQDSIDPRQFGENIEVADPGVFTCNIFLKEDVVCGSIKSYATSPKGRTLSIMGSVEDAMPLINDPYIESITCMNSACEALWEIECNSRAYINVQFYENKEALIFVTIPNEKHT